MHVFSLLGLLFCWEFCWVFAVLAVLVELVFKKYLSRKEGLSASLIWMTQS